MGGFNDEEMEDNALERAAIPALSQYLVSHTVNWQ